MNEPTIIITLMLSIGILVVPKKYLCGIFILAACFVPTDQRVILLGLDFTVLRILIAAGVLRILVMGEQKHILWCGFDKMVLAWLVCGAVIYSIQWMSMKAVVNRCGVMFDILGAYWLFRQTIRSWADLKQVAMVYAACAMALVPLVAWEWATGHNPFSVLGKVTTLVRSERYRCSASFPHAIMLGVFWAILIPLFIGFAKMGRERLFLWAGAAAAGFIVVSSASSTPLLTMVIVVSIVFMYRWRRYTSSAVWAVLALLVVLHFIMEAPVWHLLARINVVSGSTGWYRYYLIDEAVKHFSDWAILGFRNTELWGWGLGDITNQYILEGVRGGLLTLMVFVTMLFMAASRVLRTCLRESLPQKRFLLWALFAMLMGHYVAFTGVSYFGQISLQWCMLLAMVGLLDELEMVRSRAHLEMESAVIEKQLDAARV
jgi:hypothetical protein